MSAYLLVDLNITDQEPFMEYAGKITDLIAKHDGRYLVRGVSPEVIESSAGTPQAVVVIEFPSRTVAEAFLQERAALKLNELFSRSTDSRILLADGV